MSRVRWLLGAPSRWWSRSLSIRVVTSSVTAALVVFAVTGWLLVTNSSRGILEAKTRQSVSEASAVLQSMQSSLRDTDLRTSTVNERLTELARDVASRGNVGNQYEVVISGPVSDITSAGLSVASVPESIRAAVRAGGQDLYTTPTLIQFNDGRDAKPGLIVAGALLASGSGRFPVYFVFGMEQEQQTLAVVQQSALIAAVVFVPLITGIMYIISLQALRPIRAAREASERIAAGNLDERMTISGTDDLAGLGRSMNHMADELGRKIQQLENLSLVQRQFVSDVSHELRTPLTTVRMAADVLHDTRDHFDPMTARATELLHRELDRFESLLTELLEISRFDAGAADLQVDEIDMVELVTTEVRAQDPLADSYGTKVVLEAPHDARLRADPRRVRRIISNLVSNAIEHGEGREVLVRVGASEDAVAVTVRDHGVGFSAAQAHQVFQRFWRADPSRQRTVGGSGLGLSIALEDAQLHGGWLNAWGRPGNGAQFRLTLPIAPGEPLSTSPLPAVPDDVGATWRRS
ncbi:MtrAB system histidine kinase MtrB [Propioniciclava coleopterorum]|uniref:MtrAB system histidine kinase MtrB n=1 Tax=Propioniciclava coleopterorum TaxID=2714937 RepID=UPI00197F17D3|nr:MtrAB system histidine kinase MtrB [Propioniciclava coleopterorum]